MSVHPPRSPRPSRRTRASRAVLVALVLALLGALVPAGAHADDPPTWPPVTPPVVTPPPVTQVLVGGWPLEDFAPYVGQSVCSPRAKPGTVRLLRWTVRSFGGRAGGISRPCSSGARSEHKEGRAFDWTIDARRARDRVRARRFLAAITKADPASGEPAVLGRRLGIMYVIWHDRIYSAWDGFRPRPYLNSGCRTVRSCSLTLRHIDHLHVSLSWEAARRELRWYRLHP